MTVVDSLVQSAKRSVHTKQSERLEAWNQLQELYQQTKNRKITDFFKLHPSRLSDFCIQQDDLILDFSKNHIDQSVLKGLIHLAQKHDLNEAIDQLFSGHPVNRTENRAALHTALRGNVNESLIIDDKDIMQDIQLEKEKLKSIVLKIQNQEWFGTTGKPITDIVHFGIGGSDLGPKMVMESLEPYKKNNLSIHFIANIDPAQFDAITKDLNPETTLFVLSSKSFTTQETLMNANLAKQWLEAKLHTKQFSQHFMAITANPARAIAWGIARDHVLGFWSWVGGRFSIWSSIGFTVALGLGYEQFEAFLEGAHTMDTHFKEAPFEKNMPVILALLGIWYRNFFQSPTLAICPYSYFLRSFPSYIQQLDMESNGKSYQVNGDPTVVDTGPIIWGGEGTNAQHAFFQLLHQGRHLVPVDFIVPLKTNTQYDNAHKQLVINSFAQAKALMEGDVDSTTDAPGYTKMPGNKPSNMLLIQSLSPKALGQLIALYEHKVFVQGILWQINSFDQPGVELGKRLAKDLDHCLHQENKENKLDNSTRFLMAKLQESLKTKK